MLIKMSTRYKYIIFITLILSSCSFLEEEPRSGQPIEYVITSASTLHKQAVLSLYEHIGGSVDGKGLQGTYRGVYDLQTFASDEAIIPVRGGDWLDGGLWLDLYYHTWSTDNEAIENSWLYLYELIGLCNHSDAIIDQYSSLLTEKQLATYFAEVRAVRALAYTYLLDLFARLPIVTKTNISIHDIEQSERNEVFHFVWNELQAALPYLPDERSNSRGEYYGRITYPVACFMLMKLALNAEVWTDNDWTDSARPDGKQIRLMCGDEEKNAWEAVKYYGQEIVNSSASYGLCKSQLNCFAVYNEDAIENIFTIPMDPAVYRNRFKNLFRSLHYEHASALGYGGENGSCATLKTLDVYGYGTRKQDCRFRTTFFSGIVNVDSSPLILSDGDTLVYEANEVQPDLTRSPYIATAGARMHKYAFDPAGIFDGQLRNSDIVLFRFADVLLMLAEAKVRNGESGQTEFEQVRLREALALGTEVEPREATLDNIYYERWLELMWEGWHRQDMIRFNRYISPSLEESAISTPQEERYLTVFPIPQTARQTNTNLIQNKGY